MTSTEKKIVYIMIVFKDQNRLTSCAWTDIQYREDLIQSLRPSHPVHHLKTSRGSCKEQRVKNNQGASGEEVRGQFCCGLRLKPCN